MLSDNIKIGSLVNLWSLIGCEGRIMGTGKVWHIGPMHGNSENMVWVKGFSAHHPNAIEVIEYVE